MEEAMRLCDRARLLRSQGEEEEAASLYRRALELCEHALDADRPLATDEAEPLYRTAVEACERLLGQDSPITATGLHSLAMLLAAQREPGEAEPLLRRALEVFERFLGPDHRDTATIMCDLAGQLHLLNRPDEAGPIYIEVLKICKRSGYADIEADARENYRRLLRGADEPEATPTLDEATSLCCQADLLAAQGKREEAEPLYGRVLEMCERVLGPQPETKRCSHCLCAASAATKLKLCSRCRRRRYCSAACQRADWVAGHKSECGRCAEK